MASGQPTDDMEDVVVLSRHLGDDGMLGNLASKDGLDNVRAINEV